MRKQKKSHLPAVYRTLDLARTYKHGEKKVPVNTVNDNESFKI